MPNFNHFDASRLVDISAECLLCSLQKFGEDVKSLQSNRDMHLRKKGRRHIQKGYNQRVLQNNKNPKYL